MHVTFYFRKSAPSFYSIETLFATIIESLKLTKPIIAELPYKSASNFAALLKNCLFAYRHQGEVNHITGEVYYIALLLPRNNTVITLHDIDSLYSSNRLKNLLLKLFWLRLPTKRVRYVTVISEYSKNQVLKNAGIEADKVKVIPNCVSLKASDFKPKLTIDKSRPVLLQIGTKSNKNLLRTLEAIKDIPCLLLIVGKLNTEQLDLLHSDGVSFESFLDITYQQVVDLYYRSDIVLFVSTYEGFGMPILEANALGRPVITSNITAMPEVAGEGALLVNPYDVDQIREGVLKIIHDDVYRNQLVNKGFQNVQRFQPNMVASQYEALYRTLIERE